MSRASVMPGGGVCAQRGSPWRAQSAESISTITAFGEKKLLYLRVRYADDATEPITIADAERLMTEVNDFYRRHSYGQFWTVGTVTPLLTLPAGKAEYFPTDGEGKQFWDGPRILADARAAARRAGYDPDEYDLEMVRFNGPIAQSYANIGDRGAWMVSSHPATTIHEIGHNLGLHHANQWRGTIDGPGENVEYGDSFDVMGSSPYYDLAGFHFLHKRALGWLTDGNSLRVTLSGVYRVYAHDTNATVAGRTYALRIRKDAERDYWIEKRQDYGDIFDHMFDSGVLVYWDPWSESDGRTQLIDVLGTNESLPIGAALTDSGAGVKIIPVAQAADRSYMDVAVILGNSGLNLLGDWLHFSGEPNQQYRVQTSTDLRTWSDLGQPATGSGDLLVKVGRGGARAFYRAVAQ